MTSIFSDSRTSDFQIERSRGDQTEIIAKFTVEVLKLENAGKMNRSIFVHILTRTIDLNIHTGAGYKLKPEKYEASSESIIDPIENVIVDESEKDAFHQRKAILKLDSLDFRSFVNDWCIISGGYNILDSGEEIKRG